MVTIVPSKTYNIQPGAGGSNSTDTAGTPASGGDADLAKYVAAMQASSGISIKELDEKKRQFDLTQAAAAAQWKAQGLPQLAINQRLQALEEAKFAELQKQAAFSQNLATEQLKLDDRIRTGELTNAQAQQALAEKIQTGQLAVSQGQLGVAQGQLGLDTLKTASTLSGPSDWLKSMAFTRGVGANPNLPSFVTRLLNGQSTAALPGAAAGAVMPAPNSLQSMAANMGVTQVPVPSTSAGQVQSPVPVVDPNADAATRAAAYTAAAAAPAATGPTYTPSAAESSAAGAGGVAATAGMDPAHMAAFYAAALKSANDGTQTPGVAPDSAAATPADVASMFGTGAGSGAAPSYANTGIPAAPSAAEAAGTAAMKQLYSAGGQALAPQQWEGLTKSEQDMATGGMATVGGDVPSWLDAYTRSRIGQSAAKPTAV